MYTILFNYSFVKGNFLPYRCSLREFVKDLYKGLEVIKHKRVVKTRKIRDSVKVQKFSKILKLSIFPRLNVKEFKRLYLFDFALKNAFGFITEDHLREFSSL